MKNELDIKEDFQMRIEKVYDDFSLQGVLQFTFSKIFSLPADPQNSVHGNRGS